MQAWSADRVARAAGARLVAVGGSESIGTGPSRVESLRLADIFRAKAIDSTTESFVFEITGSTEKIDAFINLMRPLGLVDVSRTGVVAISRGPRGI